MCILMCTFIEDKCMYALVYIPLRYTHTHTHTYIYTYAVSRDGPDTVEFVFELYFNTILIYLYLHFGIQKKKNVFVFGHPEKSILSLYLYFESQTYLRRICRLTTGWCVIDTLYYLSSLSHSQYSGEGRA